MMTSGISTKKTIKQTKKKLKKKSFIYKIKGISGKFIQNFHFWQNNNKIKRS